VTGPWDFEAAVAASHNAETEQRRVESEVSTSYRDHAKAQRVYAVALARKMLELKRDGMAITACETVAKGDPAIASLREQRDIAEGLRETAKHAAWRANADRRDISDLIRWSARRDLAEYSGPPVSEPAHMPVYGARRAA
jgi:hypothetical protein